MNDKPTLEEMEAAYRRFSLRIDELAQSMPVNTPHHDNVVTIRRSVVAAFAAVVLLLCLPHPTQASATPYRNLADCRATVDTLLHEI